MKDHNHETLALQREIGKLSANLKVRDERIKELNAIIIQRDDQMRELQHQLATAKRDSERLDWVDTKAKFWAPKRHVDGYERLCRDAIDRAIKPA